MRKLFILLFGIILSMSALGQPGSPDAGGTITAGPPWVTGITTGGGEMALQLAYIYNLISGDVSAETVTATGDVDITIRYGSYFITYLHD